MTNTHTHTHKHSDIVTEVTKRNEVRQLLQVTQRVDGPPWTQGAWQMLRLMLVTVRFLPLRSPSTTYFLGAWLVGLKYKLNIQTFHFSLFLNIRVCLSE